MGNVIIYLNPGDIRVKPCSTGSDVAVFIFVMLQKICSDKKVSGEIWVTSQVTYL